jgi:hypothetical protein
MTDERDDLLSDLRIELAGVVPSPAFAASVRAKVAEASAKRRWLTWASVPVALAAAVLVVAAISLARVSDREWPPVSPARPGVPVVASAPAAASAGVTGTTAMAPLAERVRAASPRPEAVRVRVAVNDPFAVQVPPDQANALRSLLVALRDRRAVVPAPTAAWSLELLPELEALTIPPLQLELLPGTPAGGGGRKTP